MNLTKKQVYALLGRHVDLIDVLEKVPYTYNVVLNDLTNIKNSKAAVYNSKASHNFDGKPIDFLCYIAVQYSMEQYPNCTLRLYFRNPKLVDAPKEEMFKRFEAEILNGN
jgi:hypothetical protein